jgi:predicted aconitase with swiveling domain
MPAERGDILVSGKPGGGPALVLSAPISFWGGIDPATAAVIDPRHPDHGADIAGKVLFLPGTIGSSSASAVLMELVRLGKAPAAIVLHEPDAILLIGLVAAAEMGWAVPPALRLDRARHAGFTGSWIEVGADGCIRTVR